MRKLLPLILSFALIVGCATLTDPTDTSTQLTKATIQWTTIKIAKGNPDLDIESELAAIQTMLKEGNAWQVAKQYALDKIAGSDLEPEDKILILTLVDIVSNKVTEVGDEDPEVERLAAIEVIQWILDALKLV